MSSKYFSVFYFNSDIDNVNYWNSLLNMVLCTFIILYTKIIIISI